MIVILLLTFIGLKIKSPVLSSDEENIHRRFFLMGIIFCTLASIMFGFHVICNFLTHCRKLEVFLVQQTIVETVNGIVVPLYFIYTLPNLKNYFKDCYKTNITEPISNVLNHLKISLSSPRIYPLEE